jgi:hypothetical protein
MDEFVARKGDVQKSDVWCMIRVIAATEGSASAGSLQYRRELEIAGSLERP